MVVGAVVDKVEGDNAGGSSLLRMRLKSRDMLDGGRNVRNTQRASTRGASDEDCYVFLRV